MSEKNIFVGNTDYHEQKIAFLSEIGFDDVYGETWDEIIARLERWGYLTVNELHTPSGDTLHVLWLLDNNYDLMYDMDRGVILEDDEVCGLEALLYDEHEWGEVVLSLDAEEKEV